VAGPGNWIAGGRGQAELEAELEADQDDHETQGWYPVAQQTSSRFLQRDIIKDKLHMLIIPTDVHPRHTGGFLTFGETQSAPLQYGCSWVAIPRAVKAGTEARL